MTDREEDIIKVKDRAYTLLVETFGKKEAAKIAVLELYKRTLDLK